MNVLTKEIIDEANGKRIAEIIDSNNTEMCIEYLKSNEFFIDKRGEGKYIKLVTYLKDFFFNKKDYKKYFEEVEILNMLFEESIKNGQKINQIKPKRILSLTLNNLNLFIKNITSKSNLRMIEESNMDMVNFWDNCINGLNSTIKSLIYNPCIFENNHFKYYPSFYNAYRAKIKENDLIIKYIAESGYYDLFSGFLLYWKHGFLKIDKYNNNIKCRIINRNGMLKHYWWIVKDKCYRQALTSMTIHNSFCPNELSNLKNLSIKFLNKYFFEDINKIKIEGVPAEEILKTYIAVIILSQKYNYDKFSVIHPIIGNILDRNRIKTKKKWCKQLVKMGIDENYVEKIFEILIFSKQSIDIYDCPFIRAKNKYFLFNSITKYLNPGYSLISRLGYKDINVNFKGEYFEKYIKNILDDLKIPNIKIHNKVNGMKYECDIVFYLDNTIVFCELKNKVQYDYNEYEHKDFRQTKRITDFYSNNLEYVEQAFKAKNILIDVKCIKKLIIYSRVMDGILKKDDIIAMDVEKFLAPINKRKSLNEYFKNDKKLKKFFEGDLTIKKMFDYYEYPYYIFGYRDKVSIVSKNIKFGNLSIDTDTVVISDITNFDMHNECIKLSSGIKHIL